MTAPDALSPNQLALLRLCLVSGVGPRTQQLLLEAFGSAEAVFQAPREQLQQIAGIGPKISASILAARQSPDCDRELHECRQLSAKLLFRGDEQYPLLLTEICDPPGVLYLQGSFEPQDQLALAIVGSRRCTLYGRQQAEKLAAALARAGVTIISGLARGIDASAHLGALKAGGRTIAVMGTGLANIYPPEHADLAQQVIQQGALVSEMPLHQSPIPGLFPQRNRIISGLALGVLVVEATRNSGALHTVRHATEQGREILVVPGRIDSPSSEGCHDLLRDGATLIRNVDDVLNALGPLMKPLSQRMLPGFDPVPPEVDELPAPPAASAQPAARTLHSPRELTLSLQERAILNLVGPDPTHIDQILQQASIESSRVLATLTVLEMKHFVRRLPGGTICRS